MPLSDAQRLVIQAIPGLAPGNNIVVRAGPGAGKTKVLIESIATAVRANPECADRIVAISYTNNSAAELRVRLCQAARDPALSPLERVYTATFHAWIAQWAARQTEPWTYPPLQLGTTSLAVALHLRNPRAAEHTFAKHEVAAAERHLERCETFEVMEERDFNRIAAPDGPENNRRAFEALVAATDALEADLRACQLRTFGTLMRSGIEIARTQARGSIDWLFIDEAQDVNSTQMDFVFALQAATGCRIFAIADENQGIFKFRGASSAFIQALRARAEVTRPFNLWENFRSTSSIVSLCSRWIRPNIRADDEERIRNLPRAERTGLPVVVLEARGRDSEAVRARHARIILDGAREAGLIRTLGEAAILSYSPVLESSREVAAYSDEAEVHSCADSKLDEDVLDQFLQLCRNFEPQASWHHPLWLEFIEEVQKDHPGGCPGLDELYATLEVFRRLAPNHTPRMAATTINTVLGAKFSFLGSRPDPDYSRAAINQLSLHSSKGMEFRAVWLAGVDYAFEVREADVERGLPNVDQQMQLELGPEPIPENRGEANRVAAHRENRRLLYVGMSRAVDLLIISAPFTPRNNRNRRVPVQEQRENAFREALDQALDSVPHEVISTDEQAEAFVGRINRQAHRSAGWNAPHRYRIESFTSLTGQYVPGEERVVEIPRDAELPLPQSEEAAAGDLFHRVMRLLHQEPATLAARLEGVVTNADLTARVSTTERPILLRLLGRFFADAANQPWRWLQNSRAEVSFAWVQDQIQHDIIIKGTADLVVRDERGEILQIVDWKTGSSEHADAGPGNKHDEQLQIYARALRAGQAVELINYYVRDARAVVRQRLPGDAPLPSLTAFAENFARDAAAALRRDTARALLEQCRRLCRPRANGRNSAPVSAIAADLGMQPQELLDKLSPLNLREIPFAQIGDGVRAPFLGIANNNARWLNL